MITSTQWEKLIRIFEMKVLIIKFGESKFKNFGFFQKWCWKLHECIKNILFLLLFSTFFIYLLIFWKGSKKLGYNPIDN